MNYFEKWSYDDIKTEECDLLCQIRNEGINTFQDLILLKQQLEIMENQSSQLKSQIDNKISNLNSIQQLNSNLDDLLTQQIHEIEKKLEIEKKTNAELNLLNTKKQPTIQFEDLNQYIKILSEKQELQQKVECKRIQLFGQNYTLQPPKNFNEALKENYDLKQQLIELQKKIK